MLFTGLKFALGLAVGLVLLSGFAVLGLIGAELFARWRKKRRHRLWEAKARAPHHDRATPRFRERTVFCFRFRTDDWIPMRDKSEHLR
jgi:hypothetical protein